MSRGFTLLEMLVALLVLAAMVPLLADGLLLARRALTAVEERSQRGHDTYLVRRFLARHVEEARALAGERDSLRFVAGARAFALQIDREGTVLLRHGGRSTVLARGVQHAQLDYLAGEEWIGRWDDAEHSPRLVRLRLAPRAGDADWPELLLAPKRP